ncbi:hypothetical protein FQN60_009179, partial [Etheostoma spectabile]
MQLRTDCGTENGTMVAIKCALRSKHTDGFAGAARHIREHTCLVRFVFLGVLQRDLDECIDKWNMHAIRPVNQSCCPSSKPDVNNLH